MSAASLLDPIRNALGQVIHGKAEVIDLLLVGVLGGGHVLVEDVPGRQDHAGEGAVARGSPGSRRSTTRRRRFTPRS